jgi:hypothetical protein
MPETRLCRREDEYKRKPSATLEVGLQGPGQKPSRSVGNLVPLHQVNIHHGATSTGGMRGDPSMPVQVVRLRVDIVKRACVSSYVGGYKITSCDVFFTLKA